MFFSVVSRQHYSGVNVSNGTFSALSRLLTDWNGKHFWTNSLILFQLGERAATLNVAEQYVNAFSNLAKTNNTVVLPANVGDAGSMVAQVRAILLVLFIDNCYKDSTSLGQNLWVFWVACEQVPIISVAWRGFSIRGEIWNEETLEPRLQW